MSKKEEALRRSVLSRQSQERGRPKHRSVHTTVPTVLLPGNPGIVHVHAVYTDTGAERGRFSSGDVHPNACSCSKCSAWRKWRKAAR